MYNLQADELICVSVLSILTFTIANARLGTYVSLGTRCSIVGRIGVRLVSQLHMGVFMF